MSIKINNVDFIYNEKSKFESKALESINLEIMENEFIGLIGHTGSGKSTLVQLLNGLLKPSMGEIIVDGINSKEESKRILELRQKVGLVFQYPEYQLFEETIEKDIGFGPKNLGLSKGEIKDRVLKSMDLVGLDYSTMKDLSPFELSGGQKRRVAIAGVLAMQPKYLILDEPTAGLDPKGRDEILSELKKIYLQENITIILVSHSMEDIAKLADRVIVMDRGKLLYDDNPRVIYKYENELEAIGLSIPQVTKIMNRLEKKGYKAEETVLTVDEGYKEIIKILGGRLNGR